MATSTAEANLSSQTYVFPGRPELAVEASRVGVVDDGIDVNNTTLAPYVDMNGSVDHVDGAAPLHGPDSRHATAVAGVIVATAPDDAILESHRLAFGTGGSGLVGALEAQVGVDVSNNSWSFTVRFADDVANPAYDVIFDPVEAGAREGRGGLGTVWVFAAGNGRRDGDNTNYHNLQNSEYTIAVGAVDAGGDAADFSTPGAAMLVSAPGVAVTTTDRPGAAGYASGDTAVVSGTSFAAPAVSGIVARMLGSNPELGYRDVQEILAYSAVPTDAADAGWAENGARDWNGGGLTFHHRYGFGLADANAAERLAESWTAQRSRGDRVIYSDGRAFADPLSIPDGDGPADYASVTFDVTAAIDVDRVEVALDIDHPWRGDLVVRLI